MPDVHAVLFDRGSVLDLGTLGGGDSVGFGINDQGLVSGCADNAKSDPYGFCFGAPRQSRAFLWQAGVMHDLGTLGGPDALAELVNNRAQVVGWSMTGSNVNASTGRPTQHPFLWQHGKMRDLGTIGGTVVPLVNDLNERGQFVGQMSVQGDVSGHPLLWDGATLRDLGTLGGPNGSANWITENGTVVGWAQTTNGHAHAFLWNGAMHDLGTVDGDSCSAAYGVNSQGEVVGQSGSPGCQGPVQHAFLWDNGDIVDLNSLTSTRTDVELTAALSINQRGEIAVQGILPNGDVHAFLLVPTGSKVSPRILPESNRVRIVNDRRNAAATANSRERNLKIGSIVSEPQ